MSLRRRLLWPKRRWRCRQRGHKWQLEPMGANFNVCIRCRNREPAISNSSRDPIAPAK